MVLLFKAVSGLLFFHLNFIVLLRDDLCNVLKLLREHVLVVTISFQINRDLEMSECFSLLDTFPSDLVGALEGGCIPVLGSQSPALGTC